MMDNQRSIGFDRKILLPWINAVADWVATGESKKSISEKLDRLLEGKVAGSGSGSAKGKTKSVLMHIWVSVPDAAKPLRNEGLSLLRLHSDQTRLALHWGMCLATYPFFKSVAETVGRLIRLQGIAGGVQIRRRTEEQYGERQIVSRALRHILRTFVEWGVLQDTSEKGLYQVPASIFIDDPKVTMWLVEAMLISSGSNTGVLQTTLQSPALFPFSLTEFHINQLEENGRLDWHRHGLDEHIITLRNQHPAGPLWENNQA
jgi:hypothetical protein